MSEVTIYYFSYRLALRIFRGGAGLKTHPVCCDKVLAPLTSAPDLTLKDCGMEIYWTSQRYCNQASERDGSCVTVKPKSRSSSKRSQHARKGRLRYDIGWNGWEELERWATIYVEAAWTQDFNLNNANSPKTSAPECDIREILIRMNVRIYSYQQNYTNEYPNIFI